MKTIKIRSLIFASLLVMSVISSEAQVKITDGADITINPNSMLELESTNKGFLPPRVVINSLNSVSPLSGTVPAGMLVYSSGGTVTDGYYLWDGSKWKGFLTGTGGVNLVTKTADATLAKAETFVAASNDITLTLPAVTSADDGLQIIVKNVGTYTDLITVIPEAGKTIDNTAASLLTRWVGRTYVANGSNWVEKNKNTRPDNQYEVSQLGSFITIAEAVAFLNAHMTGPSVVKMGGGNYHIAATQTINLPYPVTFEGISSGESLIVADAAVSGSPLFICQTESYFKMLDFTAFSNAAGNDAIRFTGSGTTHEVKDCVFTGFNKGIVTTDNTDLWIFENEFEDCAGAGLEIAAGAAIGGVLNMSVNDFIRCKIGINLLSGVGETVAIRDGTFYNTTAGSDIGVLYTPASFTSYTALFINNTAWNNQGTYMSGFDFTRADGRDANAYLQNNAGMENDNPHCKINVVNNAAGTTVTTAATFYKANWTNAATSFTCKWTLADNKITYQPNSSRDVWAVISGDIKVNATSLTVTIGICKNGVSTTRYGETDIRIQTANQPLQFSTVIYIPDLLKNDFLELFCTSTTSGSVITFQDIQWFTNTQ